MNINSGHFYFSVLLNNLIAQKWLILQTNQHFRWLGCNNAKHGMKIIYFWKPLLWLAIICYALFIPAGDLPIKPFLKIPHFDKLVHFGLFFVFCLLLISPLKKLKYRHYIVAPVISVVLSAMLEISQHVISTSRSSDMYDFLANTAGIIGSVIFYSLFVSGLKWEKLF
jgi:VanZ family protein